MQDVSIHKMGEAGLLVELSGSLSMNANAGVLALRAAVEDAGWDGILETATSLKSLYVSFDPERLDHAALESHMRQLLAKRDWLQAELPMGRKRWHIPVLMGGEAGPQLAEAAAIAGLEASELIAMVAGTDLRVLTIGFAPGMPYLGQLPAALDIPRRQELNARVPMGSICLAIRQIVMFPRPTPTGWHWIGQSGFRGFDPDRAEPIPLSAGDEIRYHPQSEASFEQMLAALSPGELAAEAELLP